eukprot:NODE_190_length_13461_cov_0.525595.p10 type:complete len:148 gc:universal NODE_190_length_13461_cov_0.525595:4834-4391(-)
MTPFTASQVNFDPYRRTKFNYELSRARVRIEMVFGLLKRIFPYLSVPKESEFQKHTKFTRSLFILYNIMISIKEINTSRIEQLAEEYPFENQSQSECFETLQMLHRSFIANPDGTRRSGYDFMNHNDNRIREDGNQVRQQLVNDFIV